MAKQFDVFWTPTKDVEADCRTKGWREDDGTSFWDWVDADNYGASVTRGTFKGAISAARQALPFDVFGEVRIRRVVVVQRSFGKLDREHDAVWHVYDGDPDPVEKSPDHVDDVEVLDGDEILLAA